MKCPSCMRPVDHEAESCYSCGYSDFRAASTYGGNRVMLNRVTDAAACLRKQDRDELAAVLDTLELRFPQMLFCAYLGTLPRHLNLSELGFWLLNHGQVKGAEYARPNENAILVVMDMATKQIGISLGYFAEVLISDEDAYKALMAARPNLINAEYGEALQTIFLKLAKVLQRNGRKLRKHAVGKKKRAAVEPPKNILDLPPHLIPGISSRTETETMRTA